MKTILVPIFNQRISSRLDCAESFQIVKINNKNIAHSEAIKVYSKNQLEKLNIIISIKPDVIICNGLTDLYQSEIIKNKIEIVPWVHGQIDEVVNSFIKGTLVVYNNEN